MDLNTVTAIERPSKRAALGRWEAGDAFLAGGTWLFSEPQLGLRRLIDLESLRWPALTPRADSLHIAATCRLAELAAFQPPVEWRAGGLLLSCCQALLGSFKIWAMATVGGNLCLGLPAGPMAALATALGGVCTIWAPDGTERHLDAINFVTGAQQTALRPGEVLRQITLPAEALRRRAMLRRISLSPEGRSAALLIGTEAGSGFSLTVTASTVRPVRLDFAAYPDAGSLAQRLASAVPPELIVDDVHGTPDWRRHMTMELAEDIRRELAPAPC
jgi:CO/xanthine dehydrogenase FAD-binding subunit